MIWLKVFHIVLIYWDLQSHQNLSNSIRPIHDPYTKKKYLGENKNQT